MKKRIALVFPRLKYPGGDFSLGLAYVGAYLRKHVADLELSLIDTTYHPRLDHVRERLRVLQPDIVGIYTDTLMYEDAVKVAAICKQHGAQVILGGPHATLLPESTIANAEVDAICLGEGEETAREYLECFYGERDFERVRGIWFKRGGAVVRNQPRAPVADLDSLPFPAVDLFETERYIEAFVQLDSYKPNLRGMSLIVSRGCPFRCTYCQPTLTSLFGAKVRMRSPRNVVDEIKELKARFNLGAFYFQDDTLTVYGSWLREFCALLIRESVGIVWACNTRADTWSIELLTLMKQAGLVKLKVGIESVTDRIRNGIYEKNVTLDQITGLIREANALGIQVAGFFMLGAPTETLPEIRDTIRFAVRSGLAEANFNITTVLPGTFLEARARECGWLLPETTGGCDYYKVSRPGLAAGDLSPKRLERLRRTAVLLFYLRPGRLMPIVRSLFTGMGVRRLLIKLRRF